MRVALRRAILFSQLVLIFLVALLALPVIAFAQTGDGGDVIDPNTDLGMWSLLVGIALPALVAVVEQQRFTKFWRAVIGLAASAVAAFVTTWLTQGNALWDQGMFHAFLLIAVASWASYNAFWKPTGIGPTIEAKTTFGGSG